MQVNKVQCYPERKKIATTVLAVGTLSSSMQASMSARVGPGTHNVEAQAAGMECSMIHIVKGA